MKFSTVSCLLAALYSATFVLADALQETEATPASAPQAAVAEVTAAPVLVDDEPKLEIRQGAPVGNPAATTAGVQYPSITTQWIESTIGDAPTYIQIIYTQTFAATPDPWQTAGKGTIGYGTLTKNGKRDELAAKATGYLQPVVIELPTKVITQHIHPVTEVMVLQTFTILPNMTFQGSNGSYNGNGTYGAMNGTFGSMNATLGGLNATFGNATFGNGTYGGVNGSYTSMNSTFMSFNTTLNATNSTMFNFTALRNHTLPASLNTMAYHYPTAAMLY